jgi:3-oxoadipate enol-lactonase
MVEERLVDVGEIRLHARIEGVADGPVILFSNSLGTRLEMWGAQARALSGRFRLLRYDSRGHGRSDAPAGPYRIEDLGRDALRLLDALEIARVHVCGLSKGGMVGLWLAAHAPTRVGRLVAANTAAHFPPPELWDGRIATVAENGMAALADGVIERWFTPGFRTSHAGMVAAVREMILGTPPQGYAGCCAAIRDMDLRPALPRIAAPTLVIGGEHDPATPPSATGAIAAEIRSAAHVVLPAAHLSNIEAATAFTYQVGRFLAG